MPLNLKRPQWDWLFWQVAFPLFGPILMSAFVVGLWWLGSKNFTIKWDVVADVTPWALTFYAITLIGATMNDFAKQFSNRIGVGVGLILAAVTVSMFTGMMVIWRHNDGFKPGIGVWGATLFFVAVTIGLCHEADAEGIWLMPVEHEGMTSQPPSTNAQNAGAVAAGAAALGAVVALTVSTGLVGPIVGAVVGGVLGGIGGNNINRTVRWWSTHRHRDISADNH